MIGAMPAVTVRHERRKGQNKRLKRPSHLYFGSNWLPPTSPSPTPSPNGPHDDSDNLVPEYYLCGKLSILQIIVGALLLGSIVLVVGLVQLMPNAADADHRFIFLSAGSGLLCGGIVMTALRYFCIRRRYSRHTINDPPPPIDAVNSIDVLVQRKDTQASSESGALIEDGKNEEDDEEKDCSHKVDRSDETINGTVKAASNKHKKDTTKQPNKEKDRKDTSHK